MRHAAEAESKVLRRVAWRVNLGVFLTQCVVPVASVVIAFGIAFLLTRMLAPQFSRWSFAILGLLPLALVYGWLMSKRKGLFFNDNEIVELVDYLSVSDGLAATAYEKPALAADPNLWQKISGRLSFGPLHLDPLWFGWRLLPACLFAGAVLFVPPRKPRQPVDPMMATLTDPLAERVKIAAEVLPEAEREKLERQIEQVQAAPEGVSREKWEAVEAVEQRLENALAQSEASAYQLSSSMNQLASMVAQQETKAPGANSDELQADINMMAANIAEQLQKNNLAMSESMKNALKNALSKCKNGQCNSKQLADLLKQCQGLCDKLGNCKGGKYGSRGGVNRGRADAELVFGQERILDNATFEAKQLENEYFQTADLTDIGITTMEPKPDPGKFSPGAVKDYGSQQGTNVSRTEISPSQRGVVERYFK